MTQGDITPAQQHIQWIRATALVECRLELRPGKLEELQLPGTDLGISTSYVMGIVRIRLMRGRDWVGDPIDFRVGDYERDRLLESLNNWFFPSTEAVQSE